MMSSDHLHQALRLVVAFDAGVLATCVVVLCATWRRRNTSAVGVQSGVWSSGDYKNVFFDPSTALTNAGIPDTAVNRAEAVEWFLSHRPEHLQTAQVWIIRRFDEPQAVVPDTILQ